uniref:Hemicentin-1-like n=1 Tax=Crassostrea virginica TaxID=6565 RepID=A0A8B8ADQ3_CRAVI|nr:hemicentin-1-like [Crassostrea virginica]XP_022288618.1 hemicentin-1-like [Crassostrea virginica]
MTVFHQSAVLILFAVVGLVYPQNTGCFGSGQIIQGDKISVCKGTWSGHIRNATHLCAPGWGVCSHKEQHLLSMVQWQQATAIRGCYAINAAQDGGRCRECSNTMDTDDLAGIGRDCPHKYVGQTSCISGGRIDASCCVDAHFHTACHQTRDITGVVCCKVKGQRPKILARPREKVHVGEGKVFLLSCQAAGSPPPTVHWYKDGRQISDQVNSRVSVLSTGDLLFTLPKRSDTGLYSCEVVNEHGMDMASTKVVIEESSSGCRDGSTEGLSIHRDVHACKGKWEGHVKKGRSLCQKGWRVCSPQDQESLHHISWLDIYDLQGCYAYNAANSRGKCQRCTRGRMAGVGRQCGRLRYTKSSCLARGKVDVFKPRYKPDSCSYKEGVTTGVLCCRKKNRKSAIIKQKTPVCSAKCQNGGTCIRPNVCQCAPGYKGATCHIAICEGGCGSFATCVKPGKCKCKKGYFGKNCRRKAKHQCLRYCMKSCPSGKCTCPKYGKSCEKVLWSHRNRLKS